MVYEIRLKSRRELFDELKGLEVDAGVRVMVSPGGKKAQVFITRHEGKYAIWTRSRRPGKSESGSFQDFTDFEELSKFLLRIIETPLKAFIY